jgi:hypothetical protein
VGEGLYDHDNGDDDTDKIGTEKIRVRDTYFQATPRAIALRCVRKLKRGGTFRTEHDVIPIDEVILAFVTIEVSHLCISTYKIN